MADESDAIQQNATSGALEEILRRLSFIQKRFIIARQETHTNKEAAEKIGVRPRLVYEWKSRGFPIDEALRLMAEDGVVMALHLRRESLAKAMAVKTEGLDSKDEAVKQKVATEIIEWELGKAPSKVETIFTGELSIEQTTDADLISAAREVIALRTGDASEADQ